MRIIKNILRFGLSFLIVLACLDLYLQIAQIQTPMETRIDPWLGPTYIPNKSIVRYNEGLFIGSVNNYGYIGEDVPPLRRGAERRILLLGDSFVLGHTMLTRHHFGRFLEKEINQVTGEKVYTLNFGRADFNFWNMYQYYRDFASTFDHDLVLFFVEHRDLNPTPQVESDLYPTAKYEGEAVVFDRSFNKSKKIAFYKMIEPLLINSAVLRLTFNVYKIVQSSSFAAIVSGIFSAKKKNVENSETLPGDSGQKFELPEMSRAILRELSLNNKVVLVIRESFPPFLLNEIKTFGIPTIDLGAFFKSLEENGLDPYYWPITRTKGHWNPASQPLIGRFLSKELLSMRGIWPSQSLSYRRVP